MKLIIISTASSTILYGKGTTSSMTPTIKATISAAIMNLFNLFSSLIMDSWNIHLIITPIINSPKSMY